MSVLVFYIGWSQTERKHQLNDLCETLVQLGKSITITVMHQDVPMCLSQATC